MNKLTKEQVSLFTVIASIVMLVSFFLVKFSGKTPFEILSDGYVGWLGIVLLVVDLLVPIYLCIYAYRDNKQLEPLKPIFNISPKLAYALPLIALGVTVLVFLMEFSAWAILVYAIGACAAVYISQNAE